MSASDKIARLRELRAKATPGAWLAAAKPSSIVGWPIVAPRSPGAMSVCNVHTGHEYSAANAAAIVAAMNSLPALLECVEAAQAFHDAVFEHGFAPEANPQQIALARALQALAGGGGE